MTNQTAEKPFTDLEIRIRKKEAAGYPVEITLGGEQNFPKGYLPETISAWVPTNVPATDGQQLFDWLFEDQGLREAWGTARGQTFRRRIRLWIDQDASELHRLPWELLREGDVLISANEHTPFSRYLPTSEPWGDKAKEHPLRMLVVISNPDDFETRGLSAVDVELEWHNLKKALDDLLPDSLQLDFLEPPVSPERLKEALREGYHILHYIGHGSRDRSLEQTALYLQDETGHAQRIEDDRLVDLLVHQQERPHLIFLAACQSATSATTDAFRGLGPKLIQAGVPAVVAMQGNVTITTAGQFGWAFYRRLAEHGIVDLAMNQARSVLLVQDRLDIAMPVLFMRLKSGQLWGESSELDDKPAALPQREDFVLGLRWMGQQLDTKLNSKHPAVFEFRMLSTRLLQILNEESRGIGNGEEKEQILFQLDRIAFEHLDSHFLDLC